MILNYLIPVKLLGGHRVPFSLIQKHELSHFLGLVESLKSGDVRIFNQTLKDHEIFFLQHGIFLIVEKLKLLVYRSLFLRT